MKYRHFLYTTCVLVSLFCLTFSNICAEARTKNTDGLSRVVLVKNKDLARQLSKANTIYEIRYSFFLNKDIVIPEGCLLEFNGGSISGAHTITGNNTVIRAGVFKIFSTDIILAGTWKVIEAYPEWFGAKGDGCTDDTYSINKCFEFFPKTVLCGTNYYVNKPDTNGILLSLPSEHSLYGVNINAGYNLISIKTGTAHYTTVLQVGERCTIENIRIVGNSDNLSDRSITPSSSGISTTGSKALSSLRLIRVFVKCCEIGFDLQCYMSVLEQCDSYQCYVGFYVHGDVSDGKVLSETTSLSIKNCFAHNTTYNGFKLVGVTYSVLEALGSDFCGYIGSEIITTEQQVDKNIYHAYNFERCSNIVCNSLGAEICYKFIRASYSQNIIFNACFMNLGYGIGNKRQIFAAPKNVIQLDYVYSCSFESCKIRALQPNIYLPEKSVCDVVNDKSIKIVSVTSVTRGKTIDVVFRNCGTNPSREDVFVADKITMTTPRIAYRIESTYTDNKDGYYK